jgi:hypothetical protein
MMPCEPMPLLVPTTERNAAEVRPSSIATSASSSIVRPRPPYSSGIDRPKRPRLRISSMMPGRDRVGFLDLGLGGDQPFAHETAQGFQQSFQGFRIADHRCPALSGRAGPGEKFLLHEKAGTA